MLFCLVIVPVYWMLLQDWKRNREKRKERWWGRRRGTGQWTLKMKKSHQKRRERIFSGEFRKLVATEMLDVGYWLGKQSDPHMTRTHFLSGYLPKAGKGDDSTTGKSKLMRCGEFYFLNYSLLLHASIPLQRTVRQNWRGCVS